MTTVNKNGIVYQGTTQVGIITRVQSGSAPAAYVVVDTAGLRVGPEFSDYRGASQWAVRNMPMRSV